jgi:hypothetical protein
MTTAPPSGYLNRKIAQSTQEAIAAYTADHIKTIVKSAVQRYIESFMNTDGGNRKLYESITKMGLQFITDKSFDPASDTTLRKTQLARLFEQIRQELPCILIMDSSFEYVPANFTGLDKTWIKNQTWYGAIQIVRTLSIMVVAGTRDQSSTDMLHSLLSVLFGEMRFLAGGTLIRGNRNLGENWSITMGTPRLGKVSQSRVPEDPKDTIWFTDIEIGDIIFDDRITISVPLASAQLGQGVLKPSISLGDTPPVINFPATIPMNQPTQLYINYLQPSLHKIFITDPNVAVFDPQSKQITARQLGTFNIQVMRARAPSQPPGPLGDQTGNTFEVIASQTVVVTRT